MLLQIGQVRVGLAAVITVVVLFPGVNPRVLLKIRQIRVLFVAKLARELLFPRVGQVVLLQVGLGTEQLSAHGAPVRFLPTVHPEVLLQIRGVVEALPALRALVDALLDAARGGQGSRRNRDHWHLVRFPRLIGTLSLWPNRPLNWQTHRLRRSGMLGKNDLLFVERHSDRKRSGLVERRGRRLVRRLSLRRQKGDDGPVGQGGGHGVHAEAEATLMRRLDGAQDGEGGGGAASHTYTSTYMACERNGGKELVLTVVIRTI